MGRGGGVGLADLQVDDVHPGGLQRPGLGQHLERGLGPESSHAVGELHDRLR
jgi:hypothetical protein